MSSPPQQGRRLALACALLLACFLGAGPARADESRAIADAAVAGEVAGTQRQMFREVLTEPPAAILRFNMPGFVNGERTWDVAAHASAGNDVRFQRGFFLSAHMRF